MIISPATQEDAPAVAEIHVRTWQIAYASILTPEYLASLSVSKRETMWRTTIASGNPQLLVAKAEGEILGFICFGSCRDTDAPTTESEIWAIYVVPESWSSGIGRELWLRAKQAMQDQGYKTCSLWVFPENHRAIGFYEAAGFVLDASRDKTFDLDGQQLQEIRYVADLDA